MRATSRGILIEKPVMVVWDQFRKHTTESTKKFLNEINTEKAVILRDLTSLL